MLSDGAHKLCSRDVKTKILTFDILYDFPTTYFFIFFFFYLFFLFLQIKDGNDNLKMD